MIEKVLTKYKDMQNKRLMTILGVAVVILLIPLIAMQFTQEVNWSVSDFLIAGALLIGTSLLLELVFRKVKHSNHRVALSIVLIIVLLLVWAELAVGIFGSPLAGS